MRKTRSIAKPRWLRRPRRRAGRTEILQVSATGRILRDYDGTGLLVFGVVQHDRVRSDADELPSGLQRLAFVKQDDFFAVEEEGGSLVVDLLRRKAVVFDPGRFEARRR